MRVWPKGCRNIIKRIRCILKWSCMNPFFEHFMTLSVIMNTVVMTMDRYGIEEELEATLAQINAVFTYLFIYEMGVKLLAIGPKKYAASKWNLLDGGVVLLSVIELIIESQSSDSSGGSSISAFRTVKVFRTFRVMRVARILRALHSMQVIMGVITRSFRSFMYVILLLFVFVFIYALLGVQIYQGTYDFGPDEPLPRGNFEDFALAFVTVFQVLTMENWQEVLYPSMRAARGSPFKKTLTALYYISWIFIGNFILLNLFLAILIDSFSAEETDASADAEQGLEAEKKAKELRDRRLRELKSRRIKKLAGQSTLKRSFRRATSVIRRASKASLTGEKPNDGFDLIEDLDDLDSAALRRMLVTSGLIKGARTTWNDVTIPRDIECEKSIYLFDRSGCFRRACYHISLHRHFDRFIMFLIGASSLQLAFQTYIEDWPEDHPVKVVDGIAGVFFTFAFALECLAKVCAMGFVMDKGSYLRDSWN